MEEIDQQLETLRQEMKSVRTERKQAKRIHKKACISKQDYLVRRVQESVKHLDTIIQIDDHYDNEDGSEQQRDQHILDYESKILSKLVAVYAQQRYIKLARRQNGQLARYMTTKKFDIEDEKEEIQEQFVKSTKAVQDLSMRLKVQYTHQIQLQRSVLKGLCRTLGISEEEALKVTENSEPSPTTTKRTRTSWLGFSLTKKSDEDSDATTETTQDSADSSPVTTTAMARINWKRFSLQPRRPNKQSLFMDDESSEKGSKFMDDDSSDYEEEAMRRRSMDDDWAIPDMPWGTSIIEEDDLFMAPQLKATQSAPIRNSSNTNVTPLTSIISTQSAPVSSIIANQRRNRIRRDTGTSRKTLEVMDDFDLTFAPIEQLIAAREQKSIDGLR